VGPSLVDGMEGPELPKLRLKTVLEVIGGERSVEEACGLLRVSRTRYYEIQSLVLAGAMDALTPRPAGRPRREPSEAEERLRALEEKVEDLELDVKAAQIKQEIAEVMPHVLRRKSPKKKLRRRPW
jgi:hypothetical protein